MNQPRQIFKNTAVLGVSRLVDRASGLILAFVISRTLHVSGLGVYSAAMAYYALIATAADMGATTLMVREIAKDLSKTSRYIVHLAVMGTAFSAVVMALSLIVLPHLGYSRELAVGVFIVILAIVPGTLSTIQEAVFVAHQRAEFISYTTLAASVANIGVCVYLLAHGYGVLSLLVTFLVIQYAVAICYFFFINRSITALHWEFKFPFAISLLREMKTFAALSLLGGLFARPEVVILSIVRNEIQVGFYSAALKVMDLWLMVPQTYMINIFPVLSRSFHVGDEKFQSIQDKSIKYLLAVSLPVAAGIFVAAGPIISLLYGPGFGPSVPVLRILAWNLPLHALWAVLWRVLAARGRQGSVLRVEVISTVVRLSGGYVLISSFGAIGAAITLPMVSLLHTLLLAIYVKKDGARLHFLQLGWRFSLAALAMGVLAWFFGRELQLWTLVPMAAATYAALVFVLRAISPDDVALFRKVWQSGMAGRS